MSVIKAFSDFLRFNDPQGFIELRKRYSADTSSFSIDIDWLGIHAQQHQVGLSDMTGDVISTMEKYAIDQSFWEM